MKSRKGTSLILSAKMLCDGVLHGVDSQKPTLRAVTADTPENKEWSQWTPSGSLELFINNKTAFGRLTPGKEYYVDIYESDNEGKK